MVKCFDTLFAQGACYTFWFTKAEDMAALRSLIWNLEERGRYTLQQAQHELRFYKLFEQLKEAKVHTT